MIPAQAENIITIAGDSVVFSKVIRAIINRMKLNQSVIDFAHISLIADMSNTRTPKPIPQNKPCIIGAFTKVATSVANRIMHRNGEKLTPRHAMIAPMVPFSLYPTKIEIFAAIIPGRDWLIAKNSMSSSSDMSLYFSTNSALRIGKMTYPPPRRIVPILTNIENSLNNEIFIFIYQCKSSRLLSLLW